MNKNEKGLKNYLKFLDNYKQIFTIKLSMEHTTKTSLNTQKLSGFRKSYYLLAFTKFSVIKRIKVSFVLPL